MNLFNAIKAAKYAFNKTIKETQDVVKFPQDAIDEVEGNLHRALEVATLINATPGKTKASALMQTKLEEAVLWLAQHDVTNHTNPLAVGTSPTALVRQE